MKFADSGGRMPRLTIFDYYIKLHWRNKIIDAVFQA